MLPQPATPMINAVATAATTVTGPRLTVIFFIDCFRSLADVGHPPSIKQDAVPRRPGYRLSCKRNDVAVSTDSAFGVAEQATYQVIRLLCVWLPPRSDSQSGEDIWWEHGRAGGNWLGEGEGVRVVADD